MGWIHTHSNTLVFSGIDYSQNNAGECRCLGRNCRGDLMSSVLLGVSASVVHGGRISTVNYPGFANAMRSNVGYVNVKDYVD